MSQRKRVLVATTGPDRESYLSAARRTGFFGVGDEGDYDLLITHDFQKAADAALAKKPALLLEPLKHVNQVVTDPQLLRYLMPAQNWRFKPSIMEVHRAADTGKLGVPGLLRVHDWDASGVLDKFRLARQLDLAVWIFGNSPRLTCTGRRDSYLQLHLGFDNDGMALIDFDAALPANQTYYSMSLIGSTGAVYADDHHNTNLVFTNQGMTGLGFSENESEIRQLVAGFAEHLSTNFDFSSRWQDLNAALALANACTSIAQRDLLTVGGESE